MPLRLLLAFVFWIPAFAADAASKLDLKVDPPLDKIRPNHDEARLTLRREGEKALDKQVYWTLTVDLPPPGKIFSTDFPWIEGKRLLEIDFLAQGGEVAWSAVFPIRGRYELAVKSAVEGESPVETQFPLVIGEDPMRLFYLGLFLTGLFFVGAFIGWAIPGSSALLGLALFFLAGAARWDIGPAKVGEITAMDLLPDPGAARIDFSILRTEDQKRLFHIENITVRGRVRWGYHFFDGSPHRLTAAVRSQGPASPSVLEKEVHVEAREPPRSAVFTTYAFFLLPLAAGWPVGRWVRGRQKKL